MTITALQKAQLISFISGEPLDKVRLYYDEISYDKEVLESYIKRIEKGESVARIIGKRWFWRDEFLIENTLEPRGDSETLIEAVLENFPDKAEKLIFLDIGTGSGCLLLSLLKEYENASGIAMDKSTEALATAKKNAENLGLSNSVKFENKCLFSEIPWEGIDIIISNPPYIKSCDIENLDSTVKDFDPLFSLDGGEDGLDPYRAILKSAKTNHIFFEIGQNQQDDIEKIAQVNNYTLIESYRDLGGIIRVLYFKRS